MIWQSGRIGDGRPKGPVPRVSVDERRLVCVEAALPFLNCVAGNNDAIALPFYNYLRMFARLFPAGIVNNGRYGVLPEIAGGRTPSGTDPACHVAVYPTGYPLEAVRVTGSLLSGSKKTLPPQNAPTFLRISYNPVPGRTSSCSIRRISVGSGIAVGVCVGSGVSVGIGVAVGGGVGSSFQVLVMS